MIECIACDAYHLPAHIAPHVDFVTPSVHFDAKLTRRDSTQPARAIGQPGSGNGPKSGGKLQGAVPSDVSTCNEYITLDCLRELYGLEYTPNATGSNSYGIGRRIIGLIPSPTKHQFQWSTPQRLTFRLTWTCSSETSLRLNTECHPTWLQSMEVRACTVQKHVSVSLSSQATHRLSTRASSITANPTLTFNTVWVSSGLRKW